MTADIRSLEISVLKQILNITDKTDMKHEDLGHQGYTCIALNPISRPEASVHGWDCVGYIGLLKVPGKYCINTEATIYMCTLENCYNFCKI